MPVTATKVVTPGWDSNATIKTSAHGYPYAFLLKAWGSYEGTRDEVVSFDVNTDSPIKLRLINNVEVTTRFVNVYRIEIEEKF